MVKFHRTIRILSIGLLVFLFSACSLTKGTTITSENVEIEVTTITSENEEIEVTMASSGENTVESTEIIFEEELSQTDSILFLEDENIALYGYVGLHPDNGRMTLILQAINYTDQSVTLSIDNFVIDGRIQCDPFSAWLEPKEEKCIGIPRLDDVLRLADMNRYSKLTGSISYVYSNDQGKYIHSESQEISVNLSEKYEPHIVCVPYKNVKVERMQLLDNEEINVVLSNFGLNLSDFVYRGMRGTLIIENKTKADRTTKISGLDINGYYVDISGWGTVVKGNSTCYYPFDIYPGDIEPYVKNGIKSFEILLMTDESENTSASAAVEGGKWYPVEIEDQSEVVVEYPVGKIIYEDDTLQIMLIDSNNNDQNDTRNYFLWHLLILNKTDNNISINSTNPLIDGESDEGRLVYFSGSIGAHKRILTDFYVDKVDGDIHPEFSFNLEVKTMGGGELLYITDERVVFLGE